MRRWRGNARGLAEIVGTLMLVLIVVAAATAFAFFVASEEQATLAQRSALDLKNAENVTVKGLDISGVNPSTGEGTVITISSSDVHTIAITGILINDAPVATYSASSPCTPTTVMAFPYAATTDTSTLNLTGFSTCEITVATFYVAPDFNAHEFQVSLSTARGNDFTELLLAPIAEVSVSYAGTWPVLDGSQSYEPSAKNAVESSIVGYQWTVQRADDGYHSISDSLVEKFGESAELSTELVEGADYWINLTVTNTFGMIGSTDEFYHAPGHLDNYTVTFTESGLSDGTNFSVTFGGVTGSEIIAASPDSLSFDYVTNATYTCTIPTVQGYTLTVVGVSSGTVTVDGPPSGPIMLTYTPSS